jgi:hypothetical protein
MIDLENFWYNGLTRELGLDRRTFQISRPVAPIAALDRAFWDYQDAVPPASLIFDRSHDRFSRFSSQYALILNSREENPFEKAIGTETYRKWSEFLNRQTPPPDAERIPALFMNWAMLHSPGAAAAGASALAAGVLAGVVGHGAKPLHSLALEPPPEFEGSYGEMREMLSSSMSRSLAFDASHTGLDTGTDNGDGCVASAGRVTVEVSFGGYAVWVSKPGRWYDAEVLRSAFRDRAWFPWEAFFGSNGSLRRVIHSLVLVDEIDATITSDAILAGQERAEIESNASRGVWPFYVPESGFATNCVTFDAAGGMKIRTVTKRGNPAVIGNNVVGIAEYLDGSASGSVQR